MVSNRRKAATQSGKKGQASQKLGHDPVFEVPITEIWPSPENNQLYRPVDPTDPDVVELAKSIRRHGIREPLVLTLDGFILSGHRRFVAAKLAGLKVVPCRREAISRTKDRDRFVLLLREFNRQRTKSFAEMVREEALSTNPESAHRALVEQRQKASSLSVAPLAINGEARRWKITSAKRPFLDAVLKVIDDRKRFWPLSDRQIHYALLNDPPLRHARKPDSRYLNSQQSYKSLIDLLTRARLEGQIPMEAIGDETRPVSFWNVHRSAREFIREQVDGLLTCYWRDLLQSQPNHLEIVVEKNTVAPIVSPVAEQFCMTMTSGRGYCSLPPRYAIAQRFRKSGKEKLILLILADHDPEGEDIPHSLARSMRDDFDVANVHAIKVALTADQVREFNLPPIMWAKESSSRFERFAAEHGENAFELEALEPADLQRLLRETIRAVIDVDAFNREVDAERQDAVGIESLKGAIHEMLKGVDFG